VSENASVQVVSSLIARDPPKSSTTHDLQRRSVYPLGLGVHAMATHTR
jgi:hypothetical protein